MTQPTNADTGTLAGGLQTGPVCCKLKTVCKLESSEINDLRQFAVCRLQFAETPCKLKLNTVTSTSYERIPVCTQSPLYLWYRNPLTCLTSVSRFPRRASKLSGVDGSVDRRVA